MSNNLVSAAVQGEILPPEGYEPDVEVPDSVWGNRTIDVFRVEGTIGQYLTGQLHELSRMLANKNPDAQVHGGLGGEFGYGQDFKNDVFEMHPYAWEPSCTCSVESKTEEWLKANPHSESCNSQQDEEADCICGQEERMTVWERANPHESNCLLVLPNFRCGDFELRWYKYIGRGMKVSKPMSLAELDGMFNKCEESLR